MTVYKDEEAENSEDFYGEGIYDYAKTIAYGRNNYPPKVREIIKQYGDRIIKNITIDRTPVPSLLTSALNIVSFGKFKERMKNQPYDKLYHLRLDLLLADNTRLAIEKNEVINAYLNPIRQKGSEQQIIRNIPYGLSLNKLLDGAKRIQGDNFFKYSAFNNNCQDFVLAMLNGSNIGDISNRNFVKQPTEALFDSTLTKISNAVTDLGAKVNEITQGTGLKEKCIQSILFKRPEWTLKQAKSWLTKHDYKTDVDIKPEHYRFRQEEPNRDLYRYRTKKIGDDIEFIVGYIKKSKTIEGYNISNMKDYDSDSSSSSSDSETERKPVTDGERKIIRKINKLERLIRNHQQIHGGKINIAKAFKKLGSTIKSGFENKIEKPVMNDVINPAAKYITAKKGGLASDLLHTGVPIVTGAVASLAGDALGGPLGGIAAGEAGSRLGSYAADKLGQKIGVGLGTGGEFIHIDVDSHNAGRKSKTVAGGKLKFRGAKNKSLSQLLEAKKEKDIDELTKNLLLFSREASKDIKSIKRRIGAGFKKGSPEAKEHMAKIRAMKST